MAITLKAARINKGLSREQAAEKFGVSKDTIGNWENGKSYPRADKIKLISSVYDVSYDDIIFLHPNTLKA